MSYFVYKDSNDVLRCNTCRASINRNKHGKFPRACPSCQSKMKSSHGEKIIKIISDVELCPICKCPPTLLTASDYTYTDNVYVQHRLACFNCGHLKTNLHYSIGGVKTEWNDIARKSL